MWEELATKNPEIKKGWDKLNSDVKEANNLTKEAFQNSESFFRGTGTDELDDYLSDGVIGTGKAAHRYQFTAVSPNRDSSEAYSTGVTIEYDGDDVRKKGEPVKYDLFWRNFGENKETKENGTMSAFYMDQMEVRMDKEIPLKQMKIKNIYLTKKNAHLADKYKKLGNVIIGGKAGAFESIDNDIIKSVFKLHGDGEQSIDTIAHELGRWLGYNFDDTVKALKRLSSKESICPDCGKHKELETFSFTIDSNFRSILTEADFDAFTTSSSFVGNVRYDHDTQEMTMILNGKEYDFCNVPSRKFETLKGAASVGAAFNREIKGQHDC